MNDMAPELGDDRPLRELALFAGAGGGILGTRLLGWRPVCAVEVDAYCREVLLRRQEEGHLEAFPIWDDVRTFDGRPWRGRVDVVTGGDPCQANSNAHRSGRTAESFGGQFLRVVDESRPSVVVRENPAHVRADAPWSADRFADGLVDLGYRAEIVEIRACCLGADHQRARLFVFGFLADADGEHVEVRKAHGARSKPETTTARRVLVANEERDFFGGSRTGDGVAYRMEQLKAIGNGQVPSVVKAAWMLLKEE